VCSSDLAVLDTIKVDTEAIETAVEAIQAGQLADGHNVTIDNASGAAAVNIQDGGNSITIDGTVTANLSATDNAVLDQIELNQDSQTAILTTIDTDTGAMVTDLAAIEVLLTGIDADTDAIKTATQLIDNAISGSEMQVDVVASLPAGTNNIGDVDVLSLPSSIQGAGNPVIDSYSHVAINLGAGANQVLVSSAASKQIWVYGFGFTVNVAGTVSFQDEDDTAVSGIMNLGGAGAGMIVNPSGNFAMPIWKLATNKDLEVDVVTSELDGWLCYAIVSV